LLGEERWTRRATESVVAARGAIDRSPLSLPDLVTAAHCLETGYVEVVVRSRPDLVAVVRERFRPNVVLVWGEPNASPLWDGRDLPQAYVCRSGQCFAPVAAADDLRSLLDSLAAPRAAARVAAR
jgi:uncharacterized protein YyaL (SSP411 family)